MLVFVGELIRNLDLQKQRRRLEFIGRTRLFMLPGLLQIGTIAGTIERHFPLLATALRANPPVNRRTEAFFLADFTDRATQIVILLFSIMALDAGALSKQPLLHPCLGPFWDAHQQICM